jgi:hypothetical protein
LSGFGCRALDTFCLGRQRHHQIVVWKLFMDVFVFRDPWSVGTLAL